VIHNESEEPILLEELPCEKYQEFFMDLVLECLKGTRFEFNEGSQTESLLRDIYHDGDTFQEKSRQLATNFHASAVGNAGPGIFFVLKIDTDDGAYFALIKYDNQPVLQYRIEDGNNVTIDEIANTITQNRRALQKSVVVYMDAEGTQVIARDRQASGGDLAHYFRGFLNVSRQQNGEQVTRALRRAVVDTVSRHASELPDDMIREASDHFTRTVQDGASDPDSFYGSYFGERGNDQIRDTFHQQLQRRGLEDSAFELDPAAAEKPPRRRFRTSGGISLYLPPDSSDWFEIEDCTDGYVEIRVRTRRVWES
jgi:hypothetical protein